MSRRCLHFRSLRASLSTLLLLLPLLAWGANLCAQAPHHAKRQGKLAKEQIQDLEELWRTATVTGDVATMDKLLSDDYVGISWTGRINNKAMQLDRIRSRTVAVEQMELNDMKIKVVGTIAIVTSRATVKGNSEDGSLSGDFRYTHVYQRSVSGPWKITNLEATRIPDGGHMRRHDPPPAS